MESEGDKKKLFREGTSVIFWAVVDRVRAFWQEFKCALQWKRCVLCEKEVCAFHPNGNPFIGTAYRAALIKVEKLRKAEKLRKGDKV